MNKKLLLYTVAMFAISTINVAIKAKVDLFPGSIYFPKNLSCVPHICLYQSGEQLPIEIDKKGGRVCFTIQAERYISTFHLIITNKYHGQTVAGNTVKELIIDKNVAYKYYTLTLKRAPKKNFYDFIATKNEEDKEQEEQSDYWVIEEKQLPENRKIPDKAIILLYNANYIETVLSRQSFEFPTIMVKSNIVELIGSEEKVQDNSIELLLSSLDYNTIHTKAKKITHNNKNVVMSLKV